MKALVSIKWTCGIDHGFKLVKKGKEQAVYYCVCGLPGYPIDEFQSVKEKK